MLISLFVSTGYRVTAAEKPHMLLIIADDVSWNDLGCYGNPYARTPNIDALAEEPDADLIKRF